MAQAFSFWIIRKLVNSRENATNGYFNAETGSGAYGKPKPFVRWFTTIRDAIQQPQQYRQWYFQRQENIKNYTRTYETLTQLHEADTSGTFPPADTISSAINILNGPESSAKARIQRLILSFSSACASVIMGRRLFCTEGRFIGVAPRSSQMIGKLGLLSNIILGASIVGNRVASAATCSADNCLRALFPTPSPTVYSSNAAFWGTYTTSLNSMTTGFPSRASAACGTAPSRYSSACSCKPAISSTMATSTSGISTCTPTPANNIVKNGGFQCGLAPWIASDTSGSMHSITQSGDASNAAYQFNPGLTTEETFSDPANVKQDLTLTVGADYVLEFRTFFDQCGRLENYVGVFLNNQQVYTIDACEHGGVAGQFFDNTVNFTAAFNPESLRFEFISVELPATARIDNVVVVRI
ncbi:MAG: hypothetical protein Q9218_007429 [Villophora microphyllina]